MDPAPLDVRRTFSPFFAHVETSYLRGPISDNQSAIIQGRTYRQIREIEFRRELRDGDLTVNYGMVWQNLMRKSVNEGRPFSPLPPMFIRTSPTTIQQVDITKVDM
jgi:hypothetical protein